MSCTYFIWDYSSQQLWAELVLAYIFRKRLASSQRHVSHAVRDLFNHVYLFSSTTRTGRGVMRGSATRYGRLLINTTKVPLLASRCWKMPLSRTIWDRTRCLWQKRSWDWSLSPTLMIGSDGADSQVQGQNHWWSQDTTHGKQTSVWHFINPKHRSCSSRTKALCGSTQKKQSSKTRRWLKISSFLTKPWHVYHALSCGHSPLNESILCFMRVVS